MITMPHSASATGALPCVDIHLDDPVLAVTLSAPRIAAQAAPAPAAGAAVPGFAPARPPLSDEVDEEGAHDPGDDEEEEDEDEEEEDEDEESEDGDEDEDGDEEDDDEEDEEDEEDEK